MGLSFTIAAGPRERSHSQVRIPRDSWSQFTVWHWRLPQPGGPCPRIYTPQEQGDPVIPPGTLFPFRRLLLLARPHRKRCFQQLLYCCVLIRCWGTVFADHCLVIDDLSRYTIPACHNLLYTYIFGLLCLVFDVMDRDYEEDGNVSAVYSV
jgi:hypothetical protein